jgi:hypothetical protein
LTVVKGFNRLFAARWHPPKRRRIVGVIGVSFKIASVTCALLAMSSPALSQDRRAQHPPQDFADESVFDASVAKLTVRTAFTPSSSLSRQELFGLLLLMSVPRDGARNSMQGEKR